MFGRLDFRHGRPGIHWKRPTHLDRSPSSVVGLVAVGLVAIGLAAGAAVAADTRPFTAEDLVTMNRLGDPRVSPDGSQVVYVLRSTDLEANRGLTDLWMVGVGGGEPRRLTTHPAGDGSPRWAPDGRSIFFLSSRSGSSQVWRLPLAGGEAEQVTHQPLDIGGFVVSPKGEHLAVTMEVFVDCADLECTVRRLEDQKDAPSSGRVYDRLFVRHWDTWKDGRRSHLFVVPVAGDGAARDLTAGMDADIPSKPFGGDEEIAWAPDGEGVVFTARIGGQTEPWSTNFDLYWAAVDGGEPRKLTDSPAWDTGPVFSPDGSTLAYLAMERAGFEADRLRIVLRSWGSGGVAGEARVLTQAWDRSVGSMFFAPDGRSLYVTAGDIGNVPLFRVSVTDGQVTRLVGDGHVRSPGLAGDRLVFARDDLDSPVDLYSVDLGGQDLRRLTAVNHEALESLEFGEYEQFSFAGWNGEKVYGYVMKPVGFEAGKRYPLAFLIHGGPQGSFGNDFHYRWNPQFYAGLGFGAVMIDFHGSTGYGQGFTDSIRGDWGGKPLEDLQKGLAAALERYPWLDGDRACALGASYGGYMINWIAGNWPDGFRCLVNHDGLFDLRSMYYSTEELWFPEWELGGTPWGNPDGFAEHNPALFVDRWKTPMLVVHGAQDFRVVETQGLAAFTALQRREIPSRLLYFPDENHWVLKPRNSIHWHQVVGEWLQRWTAESP